MASRDYAYRWHKGRAKRDRRLAEDRAQHTHGFGPNEYLCPCFDDPRAIARFMNTPCVCSGSCCGNPRRHWGELTRQEVRANDAEREW